MKKILFSIAMLVVANLSISQVVTQSDFGHSSWTGTVSTGWSGSKTSATVNKFLPVANSAFRGGNMAQIINASTSGKRYSTDTLSVTPGNYEIKIWYLGDSTMEYTTRFWDATNNAWGAFTSYRNTVATTGLSFLTLTDTVSVPATCAEGEFILYVKNTNSGGLGIDSVVITKLSTPPPPPATFSTRSIYEIQYTADVSGDSPFKDSLVETTGIVTAAYSSGYWIQDSSATWNGIYVYDNTNSPMRGDKITIKGEVAEYYNLSQIKNIDTLITVSTGNTLPAPLAVTSVTMKSEMYEGVLVTASNAECVNPSAGFGEWDYSSVAGDTAVVDDIMYLFTPTLGVNYDVTGVVYYSFDEYKLEPRDSLDIVTSPVVSIKENNLEFSLYPNPVTTVFTLSGVNLEKAEIYSVNGKLVKSISLRTINNIDVSDLENGAYILKVTSNNKVGVSRFIKQ